MEIIEKLDQLAEFQAQVDYLALKKQELLDAVKIPAEVQAVHDEGMRRKQAIDAEYQARLAILEAEKMDLLSTVIVPEEIRAAYEAIEKRRREIEAESDKKKRDAYYEAENRKAQVDNEFGKSIAHVYSQISARKQEISVEFAGKVEAANENIARLTAEIKSEVIKAGKTIKGAFYQAVYVKGRVTWNTDMLDGMIVAFPELAKARKEGSPSVTLRRT